MIDLTKEMRAHIDAQNDDHGGFAFKALHHGQTDLKKLYRKGSKVVQELKEMQAAESEKIDRALAAQTASDHEIDPVVVNGLRKALKDMGVKDWKNGDLFTFQKQAVAWMEEIESGVLGYDAGLGKTPISIAYISNMIKKGKIKRGVLMRKVKLSILL